jgi:hypothetical protein
MYLLRDIFLESMILESATMFTFGGKAEWGDVTTSDVMAEACGLVSKTKEERTPEEGTRWERGRGNRDAASCRAAIEYTHKFNPISHLSTLSPPLDHDDDDDSCSLPTPVLPFPNPYSAGLFITPPLPCLPHHTLHTALYYTTALQCSARQPPHITTQQDHISFQLSHSVS